MSTAATVQRAWRGVVWYLKQVSGEARWEEYVDRCAREGREPMSRRVWERHRAEAREHLASGRCC
jgi:hypothetical protein